MFRLGDYNLVLQAVPTIDASNKNKSIDTVIDELSALLVTQGSQFPF